MSQLNKIQIQDALRGNPVSGYWYVVPGHTSRASKSWRKDLTARLAGPVRAALGGGGQAKVHNFVLPIPGGEARAIVNGLLYSEEGPVEVTGVRLPAYLAKAQAMYMASQQKMSYDWVRALREYADELMNSAAALIEEHVLANQLVGAMLQVTHVPGATDDLALLHPDTAKALYGELARKFTEVAKRGHLDGAWLWVARYPEAGPRCWRLMQIRVSPEVPKFQLGINGLRWEIDQGGDEDGDHAHVGSSRNPLYGELSELPELYPKLEILKGGNPLLDMASTFTPMGDEELVNRTMGSLIKDLTGPLVHSWHTLARAAAVGAVEPSASLEDRLAAFQRQYWQMFVVHFPQVEEVMNARKSTDKHEALRAIAKALHGAIMGKMVTPAPFVPFLADCESSGTSVSEMEDYLREGLRKAGFTLDAARNTAFGRLVAAGKGRERTTKTVLGKLEALGIPAEEMLGRLQADALGKDLLVLPRGRRQKLTPAKPHQALSIDLEMKGAEAIFRALQWNGVPLFVETGAPVHVTGQKDRTARVTGFMRTLWNRSTETLKIEVHLPITEKHGDRGHWLVQYPDTSIRIFRPRYRWTPTGVVKVTFRQYLQEALVEEIQKFPTYRKLDGEKASQILDKAVKQAINNLPLTNSTQLEVHQEEVEVDVPKGEDILSTWDRKEAVIRHLLTLGIAPLPTSKNKPGSIATYRDAHGLPRYIRAVCPAAHGLAHHRTSEFRGLGEAMKLAVGNPKECPVPVTTEEYPFPSVFNDRVVMLRLMIAGTNTNTMRDGRSHDTMTIFPAGQERTALAELVYDLDDLDAVEEVVYDLERAGIIPEEQDLEQTQVRLGGGLSVTKYRMTLKGHFPDLGKVKCAWGVNKAVQGWYPHQYWAEVDGKVEELHGILHMDTVTRKGELPLLLAGLAARLGIKTISSDADLQELAVELLSRIENEGLCPILDENGETVGEALVLEVPYYRTNHTAVGNFKLRTEKRGIKMHAHALVLTGEEYATPKRVQRRFAEIMAAHREVLELIESLTQEKEDLGEGVSTDDEDLDLQDLITDSDFDAEF